MLASQIKDIVNGRIITKDTEEIPVRKHKDFIIYENEEDGYFVAYSPATGVWRGSTENEVIQKIDNYVSQNTKDGYTLEEITDKITNLEMKLREARNMGRTGEVRSIEAEVERLKKVQTDDSVDPGRLETEYFSAYKKLVKASNSKNDTERSKADQELQALETKLKWAGYTNTQFMALQRKAEQQTTDGGEGSGVVGHKGYGIKEINKNYPEHHQFVIHRNNGEGWAETSKKTIEEAKRWIEEHPHKHIETGANRHNTPDGTTRR